MSFGAQQQREQILPPHGIAPKSMLSGAEDLPAPGARESQHMSDEMQRKLEDILYKHATGELKPKEIHKQMPEGYKANLRGKHGPVEVTTPSGAVVYIQP